jgi:hypothetical protein
MAAWLLRRDAERRALESAGSPGAVTDHLVAPALFPAMPPEVIRWDIEIS